VKRILSLLNGRFFLSLLDKAKARRERERVQRERVDTRALLNLGSDHERPPPDLVGLSPHLLPPEGAAQRHSPPARDGALKGAAGAAGAVSGAGSGQSRAGARAGEPDTWGVRGAAWSYKCTLRRVVPLWRCGGRTYPARLLFRLEKDSWKRTVVIPRRVESPREKGLFLEHFGPVRGHASGNIRGVSARPVRVGARSRGRRRGTRLPAREAPR
jgi:hypothetical protein